MTQFWEKSSRLKPGLQKVKGFLETEIQGLPKFLQGSMNELAKRGKGLRAALVLLPWQGFRFPDQLIRIAAAIEILHLATLIHDDVVDGALIRRGVATVSHSHGNLPAVLLGDLLFSRCFQILSQDAPQEAAKNISEVTALMASTELLQWHRRHQLDPSLRRLRRISAGKTASLFSLALMAGAAQSQRNQSDRSQFRRLGYFLGMGFQLQDDHLNLWGQERIMGKPLASDVLSGQYTLPLILAFRRAPGETKKLIQKIHQDPDTLDELLKFFEQLGIHQESELCWQNYYASARKIAKKIIGSMEEPDFELIWKKIKDREV